MKGRGRVNKGKGKRGVGQVSRRGVILGGVTISGKIGSIKIKGKKQTTLFDSPKSTPSEGAGSKV